MSIRTEEELRALLGRIDGRGYKAYKELKGSWRVGEFDLVVDHAQADPFAALSRLSVILPPAVADLPASTFRTIPRALGTAAFLARAFSDGARRRSRRLGTGRSGELRMVHPGQIVLPQTSVSVRRDGTVEARFGVGLPARGRRVAGPAAVTLLVEHCEAIIRETLVSAAHDPAELERQAAVNEDASALREALGDRGLIGFVAEGAHLARRSGVDDRPMDATTAVPFESPPSLRVEIDVPNHGPVSGMGIPEGVTLIVGGGYHGKSTLLRALQSGVYNHCPDDGRELVVARGDTVKIRSEDGRSVRGVDISPFIDGLPQGQDTKAFSTANASGSTSQAASIIEALESGADCLLVDEDTSATNFMIRDRRMQELVPSDGEPITPFVDRVADLHREHGVSTVLVMGGSGDYLDVADLVVRMVDYRPEDVTAEAQDVAKRLPTGRTREEVAGGLTSSNRLVRPTSMDPRKGKRAVYVRVFDTHSLGLGSHTIDLAAVEQLVHGAQTQAIGLALAHLAQHAPEGEMSIPELLDLVADAVDSAGLDVLEPRRFGDLMAFRRHELAAAINRFRPLGTTRS